MFSLGIEWVDDLIPVRWKAIAPRERISIHRICIYLWWLLWPMFCCVVWLLDEKEGEWLKKKKNRLQQIIQFFFIHPFWPPTHCSFHPEVLGFTASASLAIVFTEVLLIRLGIYLLSIPSDISVLDLIAYSGYKFVGVIVTTAVKQLGFGGMVTWGLYLYTSLCCGFFLVSYMFGFCGRRERKRKTLYNWPHLTHIIWFGFISYQLRSMRYLALPEAGTASTMNPQRKRRMWFLLMIAASQVFFMFLLTK